MRAMFSRWGRQPDAVLHDLPTFFALLKREAVQFTPLLQHALDGARAEHLQAAAPARVRAPERHACHHQQAQAQGPGRRRLGGGLGRPASADARGPAPARLHAESIRQMCERAGTSKSGGWTDYASLDIALREDLDPKAPRAMAVLDPLALELTNWDAVMGTLDVDTCSAPVHPAAPERGMRSFGFSRNLWIERDDFQEQPEKGYFRFSPATRCGSSTVTWCSAPVAAGRGGPHRAGAGRTGARHARAAHRAPVPSR